MNLPKKLLMIVFVLTYNSLDLVASDRILGLQIFAARGRGVSYRSMANNCRVLSERMAANFFGPSRLADNNSRSAAGIGVYGPIVLKRRVTSLKLFRMSAPVWKLGSANVSDRSYGALDVHGEDRFALQRFEQRNTLLKCGELFRIKIEFLGVS